MAAVGPSIVTITSIVGQASATRPPATISVLTPPRPSTPASSRPTRLPSRTDTATSLYLLGPLTGTFSPPPDCTIHGPSGRRGHICSGNDFIDNATCWPAVTQPTPTWGPEFNGWGYYSPGLACPEGYATACSQGYVDAPSDTAAAGPQFAFQFPPLAYREVAVGCCPSGFSCQLQDGMQTCTSVASSTSVLTGACTTGTLSPLNYRTLSGTAGVFTLRAPLFQYNFRPSDLEAVSTTFTGVGPITDASTGAGPTTDPPSGGSQSGLSSGSVIAIAVVIPVVALSALALALLLLWRRRQRKLERSNVGIARDNPDRSLGIAQAQQPSNGELPETRNMPERLR